MTTTELIEALEELVDASGEWDVVTEDGQTVTGVKLARKGVVLEVEG